MVESIRQWWEQLGVSEWLFDGDLPRWGLALVLFVVLILVLLIRPGGIVNAEVRAS